MDKDETIATLERMVANLKGELAMVTSKQKRYDLILALAKEANIVLTEALRFFQGSEAADQALAKYEQIKLRAKQ